jgi:hypothetical protein
VTNADRVELSLFPEPFVQSMEEAHQARAQLLHAEGLLGDWERVRSWLRDEDADEAEVFRDLKARRVELLERLERLDAGKEPPSWLAARVGRRPFVDWGDLDIRYPFGCAPSEGAVPVPPPLEGTSSVPGGSATGEITTIPTTDPWEASEPHYRGVLRDGIMGPPSNLRYWSRNWRFVIPFPCAPCDSRLTYRVYFELGGWFGASAVSALMLNWINAREVPDILAGIDFTSLPDYEVWPFNQRWPFMPSFTWREFWSGVTLQGSFDVQAGKAPVLALIVGALAGVAGGQFEVINAGFHPWEMQVFSPGIQSPPPQMWAPLHAKVHYRYE